MIAPCASADLVDGGSPCRLTWSWRADLPGICRPVDQGQVHAYLNRCSHVAMEMDYQPNRSF
jgi:nitrite reductase/ring-hydroxylating ferredoxin subunit